MLKYLHLLSVWWNYTWLVFLFRSTAVLRCLYKRMLDSSISFKHFHIKTNTFRKNIDVNYKRLDQFKPVFMSPEWLRLFIALCWRPSSCSLTFIVHCILSISIFSRTTSPIFKNLCSIRKLRGHDTVTFMTPHPKDR